MSENNSGKTAKIHYTGSLEDGTVFDSSREREPFTFAVGAGEVISGFDAAVAGMQVGETCTVTIPCGEAYGPRREELVFEAAPEQFAEGVTPQPGLQLQASLVEGQPPTIATITEVTAEKVTLDANHPLAGRDLTFEIELLELL